MGEIDLAAKLARRRAEAEEQRKAEAAAVSVPSADLPYTCPMCSMRCAILQQCSVCVEEGCPLCIPGGDRTPCVTCDAQEEMNTPPVVEDAAPVVAAGDTPPPDVDAELDELHAAWAGGESEPTEPDPEDYEIDEETEN